ILADTTFGQQALNDVTGQGWWIGRPVEMPGSYPLKLEHGDIGYIGPVPERALQLDIAASNINPKGVIDYLHYYRAYKTDYELA
ncbi:DUF2090 domain-containing protein, partial [Salmonella enterica subsp. enterica serovar Virginia]|nr:DUF2090 domain-containing protein [Salmonella enterica subsp. enterica serovar Virginia]